MALLEDGQPRRPEAASGGRAWRAAGGTGGGAPLRGRAGRGHRDLREVRRPRPRPCSRATPDASFTARGYRGRVTVVAARGLVKTYGRGRAARRVLDGADFTARAGELVAVVGRSGSGKSTLLHLLGALDRPDAGTIEVAGERVDGRPERELTHLRRRHVGFVFQFFHLVPELTGEENVLLPARAAGQRARTRRRRGRALIDRARAATGPRRGCRTSSRGGEQQRLAVARALVHEPAARARRRADRQPRRRGRAPRCSRAPARRGRRRAAPSCSSPTTRRPPRRRPRPAPASTGAWSREARRALAFARRAPGGGDGGRRGDRRLRPGHRLRPRRARAPTCPT